MAIFRIEKNKNYTVMSNHHLRNKNLSLKAKGLLSQMLSLPDDWDFTLVGLVSINKEKIDAIREAVKELEKAGYIVRCRIRNEQGQLKGTDYVIYEQPQINSTLERPTLEKPTLEKPTLENPMQINKDIQNKDIQNKSHLIYPSKEIDKIENVFMQLRTRRDYEIYFYKKMNFKILLEDYKEEQEILQGIKSLWLDVVSSKKQSIRIGGELKDIEVVKSQFLKLTSEHIRYVIFCMSQQTKKIGNIKSYLLTTLYNAPMTIELFYKTKVQHDMGVL